MFWEDKREAARLGDNSEETAVALLLQNYQLLVKHVLLLQNQVVMHSIMELLSVSTKKTNYTAAARQRNVLAYGFSTAVRNYVHHLSLSRAPGACEWS